MSPRNSKKAEIILANITGLSHEGRGVAMINGKTTFLQGGLVDEAVEFHYVKFRNKFDEGQVVRVLKASPHRVLLPRCEHYGVCGGCSLQHMDDEMQLQLKQAALLEQLEHFGHLKPESILSPLRGATWGYRRKARLGVKFVNKKNRLLIGFRERNSPYLADIHRCHVLHLDIGFKLDVLAEVIASLQGYQQIPQIEIAVGDAASALIFRHLQDLCVDDLEKLRHFAALHHYHLYLQPGGPETIHRLYPDGREECYLSYQLPAHSIELLFHPRDFIQVNAEINQKMVDLAIDLLSPGHNEDILDLFCGLGNFTLPLARYCKTVTGVEGDAAMVKRAYQNAVHNDLHHVNFYCENLFAVDEKQAWLQKSYDKILLDPPRTGAFALLSYLNKLQAKRIVYVSCNPSTMARDAGVLVSQGYRLTKVGIMNMFPHTQHVESIALFEK